MEEQSTQLLRSVCVGTFGLWHLSRQIATDPGFVDITSWIKGCEEEKSGFDPHSAWFGRVFFRISYQRLILYVTLDIKIREAVKKLAFVIQAALPQLDSKTVFYVSSLSHASVQP